MEKNINRYTISGIEYKYDITGEKEKYKYVALRVCIFNIISILDCFFLYCKGIFGENRIGIILLIIEIIIFVVIMLCLFVPAIIHVSGRYLINLFLDSSGYEIILKNGKKRKSLFVGEVVLFYSFSKYKYRKYIDFTKDMMAFYYVLLSQGEKNDKAKDIICNSMIEVLTHLQIYEKESDKITKVLYYMPVFASGFYYYKKFGAHVEDEFLKKMKGLWSYVKI